MTLYIVPQLPVRMRYQEYWGVLLKTKFKEYFDDVVLLGEDMFSDNLKTLENPYALVADEGLFTNIRASIKFELKLLLELMNIIKQNDIIFFTDIDFPGFSTVFSQLIRYVSDVKIYGYLHAGSYCRGDIFSSDKAKRKIEEALFYAFDKIFVATNYHKQLLFENFGEMVEDKVVVVGFPLFIPKKYKKYRLPFFEREYDVIFTSRSSKGLKIYESLASEMKDVHFISTYRCKNVRYMPVTSWNSYFKLLGNSKIILSLSNEETFGIGIMEGVVMGCIPVVPNCCSYVELYPEENRFNSYEEVRDMIYKFLNCSKFKFNYSGEKFFKTISEVIRSEVHIY